MHLGKERENFVHSYIRSVRKTLKFYTNVSNKVHKSFQELASFVGIGPEKITFIGLHNRRTDFLDYWEEYRKTLPFRSINVSSKQYEVLGKEYFEEAMNYFR